MKLLALLALVCGITPLRAQLPGGDVCPDPDLSMQRAANGRLVVRWQMAAGTTQLYWAPSLGDATTWTPVPGAIPTPDGYWQAEFLPDPARAFFKVEPAIAPLPPPNVRLVMVGDHFRLEWDSQCDASEYVVSISETPGGPPVSQITLPMANALEITGLTAGQTYYITIAARNAAGDGAPAPVLSGVYGPKGLFSGRALWSFPRTGCTDCEAFTVEAEGAEIHLMSLGLPGGAPYQATADEQGNFRIPFVPAGTWLIGWSANGQAGFLPEPLEMTADGVVKSPLVLPAGPLPPPPATTLLGRLTLSTGDAPRIDLPEFGLHARAELHAAFADGSSRTVIPDRRGAWALPEITGGFPITLTATYQGLVKVTQVAAPPLELTPVLVQFVEPIPKLHRLTTWQNGVEVMEIAPGVPVTFLPEVANPAGLAQTPRWIAEFNGQKFLSTEPTPVFTFDSASPVPGEPAVGGTVRIRFIPSPYTPVDIGPFNIAIGGEPVSVRGVGCWSGMVGTWLPSAPLDIGPAHPATVTVTHTGIINPTGATAIVTQNGRSYFEMPLDPVAVPPYLMRVDKPGHMRFLWPFEHQLPKEATFCVVPATITNHTQSPGTLIVNHSSGATLYLPYGGLLDPANTPWYGNIVVKMVSWSTDSAGGPTVWNVLPPNAELRAPGVRNGIVPDRCVWFEITTDTGTLLTPVPAASLTLPAPSWLTAANVPCYHQVESTGYFERQGFPNGKAVKLSAGLYNVSLGVSGLFMIGTDAPLLDIVFEADRTLNYPFEVIVNRSIFPVVVTGACQNSFGHLYMRGGGYAVHAQVLDERQGPGIHYTNPAQASFFPPVTPQRKRVITYKFVQTNIPPATLPAIAPAWARLTLGDSEVKLRTNPTDTTVTGIDGANHFLSRMTSAPADTAVYYQKIKAPATLALWRAMNGYPAAFGGTISGVGMDGYASCYYYNLGDLGFARAQTMRVTTSGIDGQKDVAFAVTNYPTLEDARCKRGAIATVCMDHSMRADLGQATPARYTRFYVYGAGGALQDCADLDGGGPKCVPNACVICHGGTPYANGATLNGTTNLGSRFLPFDLDSYTFHPKYGVQKQELANMNAAVLKTGANSAITSLITGWYGNANPIASFAVWNNFNAAWMPPAFTSGWVVEPQMYTDVFKHACRVCHISRDVGSTKQFETLTQLANPSGANYGYGSACFGLSMPHSQRTWAVFWGSRGNFNQGILGNPGTQNMPTTLLSVLLNANPNAKCRE